MFKFIYILKVICLVLSSPLFGPPQNTCELPVPNLPEY